MALTTDYIENPGTIRCMFIAQRINYLKRAAVNKPRLCHRVSYSFV